MSDRKPERISHSKEQVMVNQFESSSTAVDEPVFQRLDNGSLQVDWEGRLVDEDDGLFDDEIDWSYQMSSRIWLHQRSYWKVENRRQ